MNLSNVILNTNRKVGLSFSGGADSSLLAYVLMKNVQTPLHFFTYASREKHFRTVKFSSDVLKQCIRLTGNQNVYHHFVYYESFSRNNFLNFLIRSVDIGLVDVMYTATTSNPPDYVMEKFNDKLPDELKNRRDPSRKKLFWSHNNRLYSPFFNIDKQEIFKFYKQLNILDTVYPYSFSCESKDNVTEHCGECWWCQERLWAFGQLN